MEHASNPPRVATAGDPGIAALAAWRALTDERRDAPDEALLESLRSRFPTEREFDEMLTRKGRRRSLPRRAPVTLEGFRQCLESFLHDQVTHDFAIRDLRWMSGGGSKIQLTFALEWHDPAAGRCSERLVARLEPQESLSATSRRREAQLLDAFRGVLPVHRVYWVDAEGRWFPEPTLIYAFAEGVTKPSGGGGRVSGVGSAFDDRLRRTLGAQFVEHLAQGARGRSRAGHCVALSDRRRGDLALQPYRRTRREPVQPGRRRIDDHRR